MAKMVSLDLPPLEENPNDPPSGGGSGSNSVVVRLLVLYTPSANTADIDIVQTAQTATSQLNSVLNTSVPDKDIYIHHVATLPLSFSETNDPWVDIDSLIGDPTANSLRSSNHADLVVLLTDADYFGYWSGFPGYIFGIAGTTEVSFSNSYAIVEHDVATPGYTFTHEVGHLMGGKHENDTSATFEKGYSFNYGIWPYNLKSTIMHRITSEYQVRVPNFSNPDVDYNGAVATGVTNSYDVAMEIENNIEPIAEFFTENDLNVSISGPTSGNSYTAYTWTANVTGGIGPFSYAWEVSYNGVDYVSYLGSSQSLTWTFPPNRTEPFTLRVRVNSSDFQTAYGFITVYPDQAGPESLSGFNTGSTFKAGKFNEGDQESLGLFDEDELEVYPNPISDMTMVNFYLKSSAHIELSIIEMTGKKVMNIISKKLDKGVHKRTLNLDHLSNGIYYVCLKSNTLQTRKKIIVKNN